MEQKKRRVVLRAVLRKGGGKRRKEEENRVGVVITVICTRKKLSGRLVGYRICGSVNDDSRVCVYLLETKFEKCDIIQSKSSPLCDCGGITAIDVVESRWKKR